MRAFPVNVVPNPFAVVFAVAVLIVVIHSQAALFLNLPLGAFFHFVMCADVNLLQLAAVLKW